MMRGTIPRGSTIAAPAAPFQERDRPAAPPMLPDTAGPLHFARYAKANLPSAPFPGANQKAPDQESGRKPIIGIDSDWEG